MSFSPDSDLETGVDDLENNGSHGHDFHRAHASGRRLLEFVHPHTGKTLHICSSPEHMEKKRTELSRAKTVDEFDVVLQGSAEHLEAIRELHSYQEAKSRELKEQHGSVYADIEKVKAELDTLAAEIHQITAHAVSLDASFDRYGYSAHLRTKDDNSETASFHGGHTSARDKHEDRSTEALKLVRRPAIRQYFHKGLLWRSAKAGEVASFELFVDLVYVGVIDIVGERAVEHAGGLSLLHFIIIFNIGWRIWSDLSLIVNYFEIDDIFHRLSVIFYLVCLFGFTINIAYVFESTYTSAIAFYVAQRLFAAVWYVGTGILLPNIRGTMVAMAMMVLVSSVVWIASIQMDWPDQLALIFIGLAFDALGGVLLIYLVKNADRRRILKPVARYFEFFPAINIEHRVERNNAFVSLVFGYSILTILFQSRASFGIHAFFGKGVLGLIQAFTFNWIYFEIDAYRVHVHAIRRHAISSTVWTMAHLPFIMGYVLAAATLSQLVLAHDCADANPEDLGEQYEARSAPVVPKPLRWFYCCGLGVALISMAVISFCHIHKRLPNARLRKRPRLAIRVGAAVIIMCLPLADSDSLSSLDLISITCALVFFVLVLDLFGNTCEGDSFWTGGFCSQEKKSRVYTANCRLGKRRRREIEKAIQRGEKVSLPDIMKRNPSTSSVESEESAAETWHGGHY
ncbi:hypothetical protein HRR80_009524 [Exophiala dermatitidis]|uniref:Uncharacterized protein n=1 Tax=Exophiala dermatitidis TaxID=5970 RepID=A0AAN6ELG0_EXODE|nr:hypothetical protein HRR75_008806 [Exophiala dermatitidis]KAJ4530335.1 hypothetical protein HRR77_009524 [Exophiala dermatitidis]KAJ4535614.1 hypothetical protein HRR78_008814 [Exophiala dermatitidis]KAJ4562284.1 hypothetical protein HRR79_006613 [Exophiala dermatitidis]KAJ4563020.1 hypothetical protein HRR82_009506 [Exophiala dermatitidis]